MTLKKITILLATLATAITTVNAQTVTAKFGKGVKLITADSSFSIKFRYRQQKLFEGSFTEQVSGDYNTASNFMIRRSRLKFNGHLFTPKLTYKYEIGLASKDISTSKEDGNTGGASRLILDAVLKYQFTEKWSIWVGQTKLPGNRERVISSGNLQFVDRSNLNSKFNIDRDAGLQLRGVHTLGNMIIKPTLAITKGEGRDISSDNYGGYDYTAHVDFLPLGEFAKSSGDYNSSDLERNKSPKIAIGITYDHNDRAVREGGQLGEFVKADSLWTTNEGTEYVENTLQALFVDLILKYRGLSILTTYAAKTGQNVTYNKNFNIGTAYNTQLGYLFKNNLELAGRFTMVRKNDASKLKNQNEYTLGVSKYIMGHSLKIQSDISKIETLNSGLAQYRFRMQMEVQF